ncbi:hypothetical protein NADFUDRAFT_53256 [Nadsonia fulvescens var. elongata DSM 6958]|uniref:Autophagy-related protein 11 n=1 Tax=Nadsonia fulvescens var. elongata DSM 6958 TaxID=857566 RepID=A0A1E3PDV1_9ASCO|nr:hypothetical protein NADFUDRAFT_53256 [Nadsonia fulvescens var. elongata DSM 6958]
MTLLRLYNVLEGLSLEIDSHRFLSLDDFQNWVYEATNISPSNQLLLTSKAVVLKFRGLSDGQQVYLFDKRSFVGSSQILKATSTTQDSDYRAEPVPTSGNIDGLGSILTLFLLRSKWSLTTLSKARVIYSTVSIQQNNDILIMKKGTDVALAYLRSQSVNFENTFNKILDFGTNLESQIEKMISASTKNYKLSDDIEYNNILYWVMIIEKLKQIKVVDSLGRGDTLGDWTDIKDLETSVQRLMSLKGESESALKSLRSDIETILTRSAEIQNEVVTWISQQTEKQDVQRQLQEAFIELETIVSKIQSDGEYVTSLDDNEKNVNVALRIVKLHEREFIPQIENLAKELWDLHNSCKLITSHARNNVTKFLQMISRVQSTTLPIKAKLQRVSKLLNDTEIERVNILKVLDLPFNYGSLLIEYVRREEWLAETKEAAHLAAEHMAQWKEDEIRRRSKWRRQYGSNLGILKRIGGEDNNVPGIDLSLSWLTEKKGGGIIHVTRNDIQEYINILSKLGGFEDVIKEIKICFEFLNRKNDKPKPNSSSDVKQGPLGNKLTINNKSGPNFVFKGGSISDFLNNMDNRNSTPLIANEQIKSYEARIRKLEDLLYKQQFFASEKNWNLSEALNHSHPSRTPQILTSQNNATNENKQKKNLGDSSNSGAIERDCLTRIAELESINEKNESLISQLRTEMSTANFKLSESERLRADADATKADLLANLADQEHRFGQERRGLHQEISALNQKVEELEDSLETQMEAHILAKDEEQNDKSEKEYIFENVKALETEVAELQINKEESKEVIESLQLESKRLTESLANNNNRLRDLSRCLYVGNRRNLELLECLGLQAHKEFDNSGKVKSFKIMRVKGLKKKMRSGSSHNVIEEGKHDIDRLTLLSTELENSKKSDSITDLGEPITTPAYWGDVSTDSTITESNIERNYQEYLSEVFIDYDHFKVSVAKRFGDMEHLARKLQKEVRTYREAVQKVVSSAKNKLAFRSFKEGDLALFLPTRDQARDPQPWAAFNVGAPHYFLKHDESFRLGTRDWLVARITRVEIRFVDRSKPQNDGDNPFDLSDGLKWYYIDAQEEKYL